MSRYSTTPRTPATLLTQHPAGLIRDGRLIALFESAEEADAIAAALSHGLDDGPSADDGVDVTPLLNATRGKIPMPDGLDEWTRRRELTDPELADLRSQAVEEGTALESFTCFNCPRERVCILVYDPYNTSGDCLWEK